MSNAKGVDMRYLVIGAALLALQPAMALAQDEAPPPPGMAGGKHHGMHGGGGMRGGHMPITRGEVVARAKQRFESMDTNNDGVVTRAEFDAFNAKRMAAFQERRARMQQRMAQRTQPPVAPGVDMSTAPSSGAPGAPGDGRGWRQGRGGEGKGRGDMFARLDTKGNGRLTAEEFAAPELARFDRVDTNHDGTISRQERDAAREAMRAHMEERRAQWQARRQQQGQGQPPEQPPQ
jgi:hypothetical protein